MATVLIPPAYMYSWGDLKSLGGDVAAILAWESQCHFNNVEEIFSFLLAPHSESAIAVVYPISNAVSIEICKHILIEPHFAIP